MSLLPRARTRRSGLALVLFAATGFGLIPLFTRVGFADGLTPETAVLVRFGLPALLLSWTLPRALSRGRGGWPLVAAGGLMGLGSWGYFAAIDRLPVSVAALIFFTYPFFVTLYRVLLGEKIRRRELVSSGLVAAAILFIFGPSNLLGGDLGLDTSGVALGFLGPTAFAALIIALVRTPAELPPVAASACVFLGTILTAVPLIALEGSGVALPETAAGWWTLAGLMTLVGLLPQIAYASGAPVVGASLAAIAGTLELVVALTIGWIIFREPPSLGYLAGAALIVAAIVTAARIPSRPRQDVAYRKGGLS